MELSLIMVQHEELKFWIHHQQADFAALLKGKWTAAWKVDPTQKMAFFKVKNSLFHVKPIINAGWNFVLRSQVPVPSGTLDRGLIWFNSNALYISTFCPPAFRMVSKNGCSRALIRNDKRFTCTNQLGSGSTLLESLMKNSFWRRYSNPMCNLPMA